MKKKFFQVEIEMILIGSNWLFLRITIIRNSYGLDFEELPSVTTKKAKRTLVIFPVFGN